MPPQNDKLSSLKELIGLLGRIKLRQLNVIGKENRGNKTSLTQQLFNKIESGEITFDEQVGDYFFDGSQYPQQYGRRLIQKLKDRLLPTVFLIDLNQPKYSDIQRAYYSTHRNYALVQMLLGQQARTAAIELAEETITHSIKFGFTTISLDLSKSLYFHYGVIAPNKKKRELYKKIFLEQKQLLEAEHHVEVLFTELHQESASSRGFIAINSDKTKSYSDEMKILLSKFSSNKLDNLAYRIIFFEYEQNNDHKGVIDATKDALSRFENRPFKVSNSVLFGYSLKIIQSSILLGQINEADSYIKKASNYTSSGARNWFILQEFHLMLHFHTRNWEAAYDILLETINNEGYKRQPAIIQEQWIVYKGYIQYLITIGKIQLKGGEQPKSFRIGKFLNEVPTYSKDKRGTNISIIIIQLLFLLQKRQYDQYIDRVDALRMYAHRYLRNDETFRSNCFIQMMLQIPKANFNRMMAVRKADKYWNRLLEVPLEKAKQGSEVEIIPYETLWTFALQSLEEKPRRTRIA
jgi:hypothetical protein